MKPILKFVFLSLLVAFSFYYTEKIALLMRNKDDLMVYLNQIKPQYEVAWVDAIINQDTIIPGLNGLILNTQRSYAKMKQTHGFNEKYLVFDQVKPKLSLTNHLDKIIIKGNSAKSAVALISLNNESVSEYLTEHLIAPDYQKICLVLGTPSCAPKDYKVKPSLIINHPNFLRVKNKITKGDIIAVLSDISSIEFEVLINELKYRDLEIVSLNELITEQNLSYNFANQ